MVARSSWFYAPKQAKRSGKALYRAKSQGRNCSCFDNDMLRVGDIGDA